MTEVSESPRDDYRQPRWRRLSRQYTRSSIYASGDLWRIAMMTGYICEADDSGTVSPDRILVITAPFLRRHRRDTVQRHIERVNAELTDEGTIECLEDGSVRLLHWAEHQGAPVEALRSASIAPVEALRRRSRETPGNAQAGKSAYSPKSPPIDKSIGTSTSFSPSGEKEVLRATAKKTAVGARQTVELTKLLGLSPPAITVSRTWYTDRVGVHGKPLLHRELRKAVLWARENPARAPKRRWSAFFGRWLNRAAEEEADKQTGPPPL